MEAKTDNFIDFTTFFNVLKESTTLNNEGLFSALTEYLYDDAGIKKSSMKDETSDILRKKKAFPGKVRDLASLDQVDSVSEDYKRYLMGKINNPNTLASKLLYLVENEDFFFERADYELLKDKQDPSYIIAYILIKTVNTSDKSKELKHSEDYNPFKNYHEPIPTKQNNLSKVESDLRETGLYLGNKYGSVSIAKLLLSNGKTVSLQKDEDLFGESFSIVSDSEGNTQPLQDYMSSSDNLLVIGEGGIGKTTALFNYVKKCSESRKNDIIPLYVRLSDCSTNTDHEHMILNSLMNSIGYAVNGKTTESFKDIIDEFSSEPADGHPKYALLLDGFNEITSMDMGEVRFSIAKEINALLECSNVRIVLTTRESDLYGIRMSDFISVKATGIKKSDVEEFLKNSLSRGDLDAILANNELLKYLQIPLFLKMFTYSEDRCDYLPKTRGEILFQYYNGINSIYTEKSNRTEKNDRKTSLIASILLDFILPQVGYYMSANELFHIDIDYFEAVIKDTEEYMAGLIQKNPVLKDQYNTRILGARKVLSVYGELNVDDMLLFLIDGLGVLYQDAEERIYFCHQYVRDYFAALYCVNGITDLALSDGRANLKVNNMVYWGFSRWSEDRIQLICEIMSVYPGIEAGKLISQVFDRLRAAAFGGMDYAFSLSNLVSTLSYYEHGDLSSYDLSRLDLRECRLNEKNFSNPYTNQKTSFAGSIISETTFASEAHGYPVKAWTVSDEEHYVVSLATNMELKIWNIANQECIYTHKISDGPYYDEVKRIKYIESLSTLLIMDVEPVDDFTVAWSYNTRTNKYHSYYTMDSEKEKILFFDYDYFQEKLFIISDKSVSYMYRMGEEMPRDAFPINPLFTSRLKQRFMSTETLEKFHHLATWEIHLLDDGKILYVEGDVFPPYFHSIANELFKGPDYARKEVSVEEIKEATDYQIVGERHINLFLYDRFSMDFQPMQLDCTPDEITSLVLNADKDEDVVRDRITVSKDRRKIALHNMNDLFVYDISDGDYLFKTVDRIPYGLNWDIRYCNSSKVLTLYNHSQVMQYSMEKKEKLWETGIGSATFPDKITCTQNYRLYKVRDGFCSFRVTNLYSSKTNNMCLNDNRMLTLAFISHNGELCLLYSNGTLISLDKDELTYISSYNICPGRHILSCVYSEYRDTICAVTSPHHSNLLADETRILLFDVGTAKRVLLPEVLGSKVILSLVQNEDYVVAFTDLETIAISTESLSVIDKKELDSDHRYETPVDVIVEKESFYPVFYGKETSRNGYMLRMAIENGQIQEYDCIYLPSIKIDEIDSPILIRQPRASSLCRIRALDKSEIILSYINSEGKTIEKTIEEWTPVYLGASGNFVAEHDDELLKVRDNDYHLLGMAGTSDKFIAVQEDKSFLYDASKNTFREIGIGKNAAILIEKSGKNIYLLDSESEKIYKYDVEEGCSPTASCYLHPNILVNGCDFTNLRGYVGAIPRYMMKNIQK